MGVNRMKINKSILAIVALAFFSVATTAQTTQVQDDEDVQSWNDVQLTMPLAKKIDFFTKLTLRFGKNITRLNDGRYAIGLVLKPSKALSISPFFWYINARNARGEFRIENRLSLSATYRFPIKKFGLTHRSTYEYRMRAVNTWRYRAQMTFDKDIPKHIIPHAKFFFGDDVFYDSATGKFSRNRFSIGITKTINKNLSVDIYYMRQNDGFSHPGDLNTIWTAWKIKL